MGKKTEKVAASTMIDRFQNRFWQRPRAHGEIITDRTVSFLELFYDLVYVVLIARAAHTLSHHITWQGAAEFAVIFGLIWIAWFNGTAYHELHSRQDGRSRTFIFIQMMLLATLAIYTSDAAGEDGAGFALVYVLLLLVLTWLWYAVRRIDDPEYNTITGRYIAGMLASVAVMAGSILLPEETRIWAWGALVIAWTAMGLLQFGGQLELLDRSFVLTDSFVERFGLFTIIVLGEVVVGVVNGLSDAHRGAVTIATGLFGLQIGFGFWWTYFDFVGRREPRHRRFGAATWIFSHLPLSMSIAAAGAAMVSLVEHADAERAALPETWLLVGATTVMLLSLTVTMRSLADFDTERVVYRQAIGAVAISALGVLAVGIWRPSPLLLTICISAILLGVWWFAVDRWLRYSSTRAGFEALGGSA